MSRRDCPAFGEECRSCGRENHFANVCERKSKSALATEAEEESEEEMDDGLGASFAFFGTEDFRSIPSHNANS